MDGHDAHLALRTGEFALDLAACRFDGVEEKLQACWTCCVELGRAVDEGGDRFARRTAHATEDKFPAGRGEIVMAFQGSGEEFERRQMGVVEQALEEGADGCMPGVRGGLEFRPDGLGAVASGCEREEVVVIIEPAEGALEDLGEDEVVGRTERETDEVEEVLHGETVEQGQPVGAGDGQLGALELLQDGVEQTAGAPLHEDQEIAGRAGALFTAFPDSCAGIDLLAYPFGDLGCKLGFRVGVGRLADGRIPRIAFLDHRPRFDRPELDAAGFVATVGGMLDGVGLGRRIERKGGVAIEAGYVEGGVDIVEHFRRGAERHLHVGHLMRDGAGAGASGEVARFGHEAFGVCALEGIDRLLLVADDEERAQLLALGAGA